MSIILRASQNIFPSTFVEFMLSSFLLISYSLRRQLLEVALSSLEKCHFSVNLMIPGSEGIGLYQSLLSLCTLYLCIFIQLIRIHFANGIIIPATWPAVAALLNYRFIVIEYHVLFKYFKIPLPFLEFLLL